MSDTCKIINLDNIKGLSDLRAHCGTNIAKFNKYLNFVAAEYSSTHCVAKPEFANWYKNQYKEDIDFINGNPSRIEEAIKEYYKTKGLSVTGGSRISSRISTASSRMYSTPEARVDAMLYIADTLRSIDKKYFIDSRIKNPTGYLNYYLDNRRGLAYDLVDSSNLSKEDRTTLRGKIKVATTVSQINKALKEYNLKLKVNTNLRSKRFFKYRLIKGIEGVVAKRIADSTNDSLENVKAKIADMTESEVVNILGADKISDQNRNFISMYFELKTDTDKFFDEIVDAGYLDGIDFYDEKSLDSKQEDERVSEDEAQGEPDSTRSSEDDGYGSVVAAYDHTGLTSDALSNIDHTIKAHLASIKKLNSTNTVNGEPDYDRNNSLGVPQGIDVHKAYGYLYHQVSYDNKESMIRSIRLIADTHPDMVAFHTLANELEADEDLANLYWNTFAKLVIAKSITKTSPKGNEWYISNTSCDVRTTLQNQFINSVRHTSYDILNGNEYLAKANYIIDRLKQAPYRQALNSTSGKEKKAELIKDITELVRVYYPCIDEKSIKAFIDLHKDNSGKVDSLNNISDLASRLKNTINPAIESYKNYSKEIARINTIHSFNKTLDGLIDHLYTARQKENVTKEQITEELSKLTPEAAFEYIHKYLAKSLADQYDLYSYKHIDEGAPETEDYTTEELRKQASSFADLMLDYSVVNADLNSVNAKRNQVSSVINSSFLTNMITILQNEVLLGEFGKDRSKSAQYNLSNIMYEHKGATPEETTYGLFRKDANGNVTPTEYATELLKVSLFDGANDETSGRAALYFEMTKGDYLGTAFVNFFDTTKEIGQGDNTLPNIKTAGYFMRIPSDAKNNFVVSAPKYSISGLYSINNYTEIESKINERINSIKRATNEEIDNVSNENIIPIDDKNILVEFITNTKSNRGKNIRLPNAFFKGRKDGEEVVVGLQYLEDNNSINDRFIIKGIIKDRKLVDAKFIGLSSELGNEVKSSLHEILFNALDNQGQVQRTYNVNHPLFAGLKRTFRQEIIDMAVAIDSLFETWTSEEDIAKQGLIRRYREEEAIRGLGEEGAPVFKAGKSNIGNDNPGCYANYHYKPSDNPKEKGGVIIKKENGTYKFTGNVFESNRFTIIDKATGKRINLGNELVQKLLNPLYGGSSNTFIKTKKVNGKIEDVDLSSIDTQINSMIAEYIDRYVKNTIDKLSNYVENISNVKLNFDTVGEFGLNHRLTYIGFDDLFEGNSKLYKSDQDAFKRTKEVQGSGNPYGNPDFLTLFGRKYDEIDSILDTDVFKKWGIRQHNQYRGVTIRNTKMTGPTIGSFNLNSDGNPESFKEIGVLSQKLIDEYKRQGFTSKEATDKAFEIMSRYYNPKVNDAQSYITFDEWVRRIARRGQLFKYKPLIDKIKSGKPLLAEELDEFVQVQKNFQYDIAYDEDAQAFFSRQIKNAEFVLVPQLIEGTELETVAKLMNKYGIDQLNTEETSKAGKTNILEVFDKSTGLLKQDIIDEIENGGSLSEFGNAIRTKRATQYYNYEFLFTQQETHQHVQADNKAGVQIMKKMLDNIDENSPLWETKQKFIKLYTENIADSAKEYYAQFGIDLSKEGVLDVVIDENGKATLKGLNLDKFYEIYRRELRSRKDDTNLLDFATLEDTGIEGIRLPKLPDFLTLTSKTLEQVAQSMINNNIVRQMLPGFHGPQVTSIGFNKRSINEIGGGNTKAKYSDKLKFYPDGKPYIEVMVSPSFFGLERKDKDGNLKSKDDLFKELEAAKGNSEWGVDTFIGYRIPTEAKYSVAVMKVVDFVDDAYGSTIIVPNDWVAQTGSDFDVDSIYGINAHTYIDKEGHIQKVEEGKDSRESRDNGILNCMLKIMQDDSTIEERLLTSNTEHIGKAIDNVVDESVKKAKKSRSQYDIIDQVENHDDAISGMELKAISVAWDGLISIANSVGMYLPKDQHIFINGHELKQFGDDSEHNHRNYAGHLLTAYSAETSPYEFDAIKMGAIPNINKFTFGVFKFLSGVGVDYDSNIEFMTRPGITRLVKLNDKYNSIYSPYSPNIINKAIEEIAKELNIDTRNLDRDSIIEEIEDAYPAYFDNTKNLYSEEGIHLNINRYGEESSHPLISEIQDILTFERIQNLADKFTALSMVLRGDKISAKKSIYETEDILEKAEELANDNTITTKEGKNIIDAIFPGLVKEVKVADNTIKVLDIPGFMAEDRTKDSEYKVLYTFMRYATIPSIIINKQLFSTQNPIFKDLEKKVRSFNTNGRRLSADAKEKLTKYAISQIYDNVFLERTYLNNEIPEDFSRDEEVERIYGYKIVSEPIDIIDLNNPKDNEIEEFKHLSPAEQVLFLQDHLIGDNVFNLFEVELKPFNNRGHRIKFNSTNNNLELARRLFAEAFFDENPLINIAAHNVFKYAFIVEGYSMRKDGVSNVVSGTKNICLEDYVEPLRREFDTLYGRSGNILSTNLALDFARSNTDLLSIPTHFVESNLKNVPELIKVGSIIAVPEVDVNKDIIEKYDIKEDGLVKLKFKQDKKEDDHTLYRCVRVANQNGSIFIIYPLNKLEAFEHGEFSRNSDNWKHPSSVYFKNLITTLQNVDGYLNIDAVKTAFGQVSTEGLSKTPVRSITTIKDNREFDINNPTDDLYGTSVEILKKVRSTFNGEVLPSTYTFGIYPALDKYIRRTGKWYGEPQVIKVNEGTEQERDVTVSIWRLPHSDRNKISRYVRQGKTITDDKVEYKDIINSIINDYGIKFLNENIYMITPPLTISKEAMEAIGDESELKHASIRETSVENAAYQSYETVRRIAKMGNTSAERIQSFWEDAGLEYNKESITSNIETVLTKSAPMLRELVSSLDSKVKNFYKDPDSGEWLSINDKRLAPVIATNKDLEQDFLQTLNLIDSIGSTNTAIISLNIDSHDDKIKHALGVIRSAITEIKDNVKVLEAKEMYAVEVLGKRSTNPLIKQDLIDIFSPHYSTNFMNSWFSDMLETSNPFAQVLLKKVTDDIYRKELVATQRKRDFLKYIDELNTRAKQAGLSIDVNKFINERGVIIQNFTEKLSNDLQAHRDKIKESKAKYEQATDYVTKHNAYKEYLEKKLEYDKFLIDHIEQPIVKDYYIERYNLEHSMLYGTMTEKEAKATGGFFGNPEALEHADILVRYNILRDRQFELYGIKRKGLLDDQQALELESIEKQLSNLMSPPNTYSLSEDVFESETPLTEEEKIKSRINNTFSRRAIINYVNAYNSINEKYFKYDPEFGFDEELERNLRIIENRELRDPNGNLRKPMSELMEDPEYVRAKLWIKQYTLFVPDEETEKRKNEAFAALGSSAKRETLKKLIRDKKARDDKGVVDARLFTDEEIASIKNEQLREQTYAEGSPVSDRILISFAKRNNTVYKNDFYLGMMSDGTVVDEWINTARRINELLTPFYNETFGGINWREMGNTIESRAKLRELGELYRKIDGLKKKEGSSNSESVKEFFEKNVDDTLSQEEIKEFQDQQAIAKSLGEDFYNAWKEANILDNGKINTYLYHALRPKAEVADRFIDKKKTEALKTLDELYTEDYTEYYYAKYREMKEKGREEFEKWYEANHIYNFRTRRFEPIRCWIGYQYKDDIKQKLKYVPKRSKTTKEPKDEYVNPNYKKNLSHSLNYIEGTGYDNPELQRLNPYEVELKQHINTLLHSLVRSKRDHDYIDKGYLPYQRKQKKADAKFWGKELLAAFGWSVNNNGTDAFDDIDYAKNDHLSTPMLELLDQVTPKEDNVIKPEHIEGETDADFNKRMADYEEKLKEHKEKNRKRHEDAINKDWINVIADFITEVGHFNAVQDNYELLHYGKNILDDYKVYVRKFGFFGDYKYDRHSSSENSPDYIMKRDENVAKQYENYIRRLLLNQWKESNEKVTKWASRFQNLTSAQYMMMNIRGGIANVTLGQTQVAAEAHAKAIIDGKSWMKSEALYMSAIPSFALHMNDDKASTLVDAIIKAANVIDYDEKLGKARIVENPTSKAFGFFNRAMYSPQAIGEHYMQNRVLIASTLSHHVYTETDPLTGETTVVFKNRGEVIQDCAQEAMMQLLTDEDKIKFNKLLENIKKDPNKNKEFAWYKEDLINIFAKRFIKGKEKKREYVKLRKEFEDKRLKEFDNAELHPNVFSQLALSKDGYMEIKPGTILSKYDTKKSDGTPSDAITAFAALRNRVISTNKKIHGVYDKLGQAQIERKWFGSLVMQYHKHIPIGIAKRYRKEGYYNEIRGTVEKGSYVSLINFLSTPFKTNKKLLQLTDDEVNTLEGVKNIFKSIIDFTTHVGLYWNMLPEYEKANIRRNLGDLKGILAGMLLAVVLKGLGDDDDDSIPYNLALYEIDRLGSEAAQFTPSGAINEFKKLWSAPIAAQSGISDMWQSMDILAGIIFGGDDFDPYFRTGRFAGQHKLRVYIERRIPIWRGIKTGFIDITEQNSYFKLRQNVGGSLVNNALNWIEDED